jgi:hypothetical protein
MKINKKMKNKILGLIESAKELLEAIKLNNTPIEGTTGITSEGEVATGGYIRQQYIADEMEELEISIQNIESDISEELPLGAECSSDWLRRNKDENGFVTLNLDFDLNEFIENDIEWLNDESSQRITGSEAGLTDISYKTISVLDNGRILIAVTGNVNDFLDELDEEDNVNDFLDELDEEE